MMLDLFAGIGGFSLAGHWAGFQTAAFCEIEPFCQKVLAKNFPGIPIYDDIRSLTKERMEADGITTIDIITAGYPCQSFSLAGQRKGQEDDRYLWPEVFRLIQEIRPTWILCENVAGHVTLGIDTVLSDLEGASYACQALVIPACAIDAQHRRDRVWIVANSESKRCRERGDERNIHKTNGRQNGQKRSISPGPSESAEDVAKLGDTRGSFEEWAPWPVEPSVGRVVDGLSRGMDRPARIRALGNSIVPQVAHVIFEAMKGSG